MLCLNGMKKIAIFASGGGSNFKAIYEKITKTIEACWIHKNIEGMARHRPPIDKNTVINKNQYNNKTIILFASLGRSIWT